MYTTKKYKEHIKKLFRNTLCKLSIHSWMDSADYVSDRTIKAQVCKNCYTKHYVRKSHVLVSKATHKDILKIKLSKILKKDKKKKHKINYYNLSLF